MRATLAIAICLCLASTAMAEEFDHGHHLWNDLLGRHVRWNVTGTATRVDYAGMQKEHDRLNEYTRELTRVSATQFNQWPKAHRLAFLINAYNAFTVQLILTRYPNLDTIKDIGGLFKSPWKIRFFTLLGKARHLDEIEHDLIRQPGVYDDPRIHAAVNCAAIGCPALRNEAYIADRLDAQLEDNMIRYLRDRDRNRYEADTGRLVAGKVFDWYESDFKQGYRGITSLRQFFSRHADILADTEEGRARIAGGRADIAFSAYDWRLNRQPE